MDNYKKLHPCVDCGETDYRVLQFDHIDPMTKIANVTRLASESSMAAVIEEISKCEVRCANCHQLKHSGRNRN
jgi:hypothetical protein